MIKKNWLVVSTIHERYGLETSLCYFCDYTIDRLVELLRLDKIETILEDNCYMVDLSCRNPMSISHFGDSYPNIKDMQGLAHMHLEAIMIVSEDFFRTTGCVSQSWGASDSKFGLLDYNREE